MAAKFAGCLVKMCAVIFTSVLAPVVVGITLQDFKEPSPAEPKPAAPAAPASPANPHIIRVVTQGTGRSPDEALQGALRTALGQALAELDRAAWLQRGEALVERLSPYLAEVVHGWQEITARQEMTPAGTLHTREVSVEINRLALAERLRSTTVPSRTQVIGERRTVTTPAPAEAPIRPFRRAESL